MRDDSKNIILGKKEKKLRTEKNTRQFFKLQTEVIA